MDGNDAGLLPEDVLSGVDPEQLRLYLLRKFSSGPYPARMTPGGVTSMPEYPSGAEGPMKELGMIRPPELGGAASGLPLADRSGRASFPGTPFKPESEDGAGQEGAEDVEEPKFARFMQDYEKRMGEAQKRATMGSIFAGFDKSMAEAANLAGYSGAHIRSGARPPALSGAGVGQGLMAASESELDMLKNLPGLKIMMSQMMTPYQKGQLALGRGRLEELAGYHDASLGGAERRDERAERREERMGRQFETTQERLMKAMGLSERRLGRMDEATNKEIRGISYGLDGIRRIREEFKDFRNGSGPVIGRVNKVLSSTGVAPKGFTVMEANVVDLLAQYVRSISGAQVHVSEFERLKKTHPQVYQTPENFEALLDNMEDVLKSRADLVLKLSSAQGRETESTREIIDSIGGSPAQGVQGGAIPAKGTAGGGEGPDMTGWPWFVHEKTGRKAPVHPTRVEEAKRAGWFEVKMDIPEE